MKPLDPLPVNQRYEYLPCDWCGRRRRWITRSHATIAAWYFGPAPTPDEVFVCTQWCGMRLAHYFRSRAKWYS